jgi:signal transduction histidine kinase
MAVWGDGNPFGVGATFEPWPGVMLEVRRTGRPARLEGLGHRRAVRGWLRATVEDDGIGWARLGAGSGLVGPTDRVEALGGRLALESRPGQGTRLTVVLPLRGPGEPA